MQNDLKPCPFCGSDNLHIVSGVSWSVKCHGCWSKVQCQDSREDAIRRWNIRAKDGDKLSPPLNANTGHPVECAAIEELQCYAKSADANPELYRDGWECAMQCAINVLRRHQSKSTEREAKQPNECSSATDARKAELDAITADSICADLVAACNGHPFAKIKWPHYLLHNAAYFIKKQHMAIDRQHVRETQQPGATPNDSETVGAWPDNIVAQRHEVSCKWWLMYLDDLQAALCQEALMRPTEREAVNRRSIESAPKGIPVIVAGGIAMQKTGGQWFTGMEEPLYTHELQWKPLWWMPIPNYNDDDIHCEEQGRRG